MRIWMAAGLVVWASAGLGRAQTAAAPAAKEERPPDVAKVATKDDLLRGGYGPYRANNDLLFYHLRLRVDPVAKTIAGTNVVRFKMLEDGRKIQLELTPELTLGSVMFEGKEVSITRDQGSAADALRTFYVEFPRMLKKGEVDEVTVAYSGRPVTQGRFGCFSFDKDKEGKPWITTSCEDEGASMWWPNKDQWRDKPQDGMEIDVAVPNGLMDVSNGRLVGSKDLGDGYTEWEWRVHAPISNYDVALNIGEYVHWSKVHANTEVVGAAGEKQIPSTPADKERLPGSPASGDDGKKSKGSDNDRSRCLRDDNQKGKSNGNDSRGVTTMDYYALPEDLEKAKVQFRQVPVMLDAYEHYFGEYPFDEDGYKLIEVPYAGMEHQSAVAYGNGFENGYLGVDWTGVGISPRFDFIIVHESAHEWFGNAVTAKDVSDMWIHEGWATYMESLYVEYRWGKADAIQYLNGLKPKIHNERAIVAERGKNQEPPADQYFKGALMLNTLRSVIGDDAKWFADIRAFYQAFEYQTIMTEDVVAWWSKRTGTELGAFFGAYLREATVPVLEVKFDSAKATVSYRWKTEEVGFAMPIEVGDAGHWTRVMPVTGEWKSMRWDGSPESFQVATDLYYVDVVKE